MQDEQAELDQVLADPDPLLVASLRQEERQRRRRRLTLLATLVLLAAGASIAVTGLLRANRVTADDTARANALSMQGWRAWQEGKPAAAIQEFEQALQANPNAAHAWNGLGWAHIASGNANQAERALQECIRLVPGHAAALNGLGHIAMNRRDYPTAERCLLAAADDPEAISAWRGLAQLYLLQGNYRQAVPWAEKMLQADPDDREAAELLAAAKAGQLEPKLRRRLEPEPR